MKQGYEGFTLLELMLVVTVIGILTAVAVPAYIDNYKRARASEIVSSSYGLKSAIQVCMADFPEDYEANCVAGLNYIPENLDSGDAAVALTGSKMIKSRTVANGTQGVNGPIITITATTSLKAAPNDATGMTYILTPVAGSLGITWTASGTCIESKYCRQ